ncbi:MAG TPA: ATP-grasp domain-containing protein, partial [Planctomycetaceae bacterium]|nr:ATP-grasp domain-containing protein [Planctomycetaceae bacterium]
MSIPILIVGASVRATAQSARRAGFAPLAIDLFADVDLQEIAQTRRSERYPDDLPILASELPDAPFLYTGALENSPEILKELQSVRPLWGNGEEQLRLVRDPLWVQEVLSQAGFPSVPTRRTPPVRSETQCWLRKPLASAAGLGIDFDSTASRTTDVYWQRFIPGVPISTLYIADDRNCQMIGTARQWVGWPEFPVGPFQFCGAIVPARISVAIRRDLELIGTRFAELAGLRGLFGIDLIQ